MSEDPKAPVDLKAQLAKALLTVKKLRARLEQVQHAAHEPIAIVGMACRFPGGVRDEASFIEMLRAGTDAVGEFPRSRANADRWYDPNPDAIGKAYTMKAGYLDAVDGFDPTLFGITPREAVGMDPQQRLALEVAWEAVENAGISPTSLQGSRTGVYVGVSTNDYVRQRQQYGLPEDVDAYNLIGEQSFIAGRISYTFGLHGPSQIIDTACSSSLVAIHQAVRSLRTKESDLALVGGVNLILSPFGFVLLSKISAISPNGRCATFDAKADGYTRGEGCAFVVLKRLSDAQAAGDEIFAVVRGAAVNHGGRSSGLTVPNNAAQQAVIQEALADAQIEPAEVSYVEAHGTGTALGDPIELRALEAVFGAGRSKDDRLLTGSVKTNFGHLEAAAGIAGLLKVVVSLRSRFIPPHLHFTTPTPNLDWKQLHIDVVSDGRAWTRVPRIAGVSSFGASGTNAHVVLAEAPPRAAAEPEVRRPQHILTLSAKTEAALTQLAGRLSAGIADGARIEDVCFTANTGRARLPQRAVVVAASIDELRANLAKIVEGRGVVRRQATNRNRAKVTFLFPGQGAQTIGMGKALYDHEPVFRVALDRCAERLRGELPKPLLDVIFAESEASPLDDTRYAQPALFAVEYAMAELWASWGVKPRAVMGHSVGEFVAAVVAGVLSLEDGLTLIAARGRLMSALPAGGAMCQIGVDEARAKALIAEHPGQMSIAGINGPTDTVLSGTEAAIDAVTAKLSAEQVTVTKLRVSHAFHSHLMEPMLAEFEKVAASVQLNKPKIKLISNLTGAPADDRITTPRYWCEHIRAPVRFLASMETLHVQGAATFLEVGPQRTLTALGRKCLPEADCAWVASMRCKGNDLRDALVALGELYTLDVDVDWSTVHAGAGARRVPLPTYPFQHQRYWFDMYDEQAHPQQRSPRVVFESRLDADALQSIEALGYKAVAPAVALLEAAHAAAKASPEGARAIEGILIEEPLALAPGNVVVLQVIESPDGRFEIYSQTDAEAAQGLSWIRHLSGRFVAPSEPPELVSIDGLATVTVPDELGYAIHPAILDAAFHALGEGAVVEIDRLDLRGPTAGTLHLAREDRSVRLLDARGAEILALRGVTMEPFRAVLRRAGTGRLRNAMYELVWQARPRAEASPAPVRRGPESHAGKRSVVFADRGGLGDRLASALEAAGESVLRVPHGDHLDPASIVGDLNGADRIVFLWGLDAPPPASTTVPSLLEARTFTTDFVIELLQALLAAKLNAPPRLWLVTRGAQPAARRHAINVAASGLWGLGRVLGLEQPDVWGGMIDLDPDGAQDPVPALLAELVDGGGEDQIALRAEGRLAPRLIRSPHEDRPLRRFTPSSTGVYLITGGLGGLGLTVARWLVEQGARHIAITSRGTFPGRATWGGAAGDGHDDATRTRIEALSGLEALGAEVHVIQADVGDGDRMKAVIAELNAVPGGLRGVLHTAGISRPQDITEIDLDTFNAVLKPKVEGAWILHELTKDLDLEFFLMFSSIASVWGSQHIASYATANHVLDALAHHRASLGIPGLSVNWGPWLVESNLADTEVLKFLEAVGLRPFQASQGTELMGHLIMSKDVPQMVVSGVDWSVFKSVYEARGERPLLERIKVSAAEGDGPAEKSATLIALESAAASERPELVLAYLRGQLADIMRLDADSVDLNADVVTLGVDSMMMMEVIKCCKKDLQVTILPKDLFDRPKVTAWATFIGDRIASTTGATDPPLRSEVASAPDAAPEAARPDWTKPANLLAEVALADDVRPTAGAAVARLDAPSAVLLTGSTGFVGAFLLAELLARTDARIHCLVRGDDPTSAKRRIRAAFEKYERPWDGHAHERVVAIPADLTLPRLGLSDATYDALAQSIDGIFHCGALVNYSLTYEQSRLANVAGTEEVLRLSCRGRLKPVHYVSTFGLWGIPDDPRAKHMEDDDILAAGKLINGYLQSKWVAEKVAHVARDRGLPVNTYRLGQVMGDSERGVGLTTSWTCALLKGCIQLGKAPSFGDRLVEMMPVDHCARAMVHIAKNATRLGTTFHLINPARIRFGDLVAYMQRRGYALEVVSPKDWHESLLATLGTERVNVLHPLMGTVEEILHNPDDAVTYDQRHVLDALAGSSIACPPLDQRLLDTYFTYFTRCGWLEGPPTRASA